MAHDFFHGLMSIGQSEGQCSCQILPRCKFIESVTMAKVAQLYRAAKCPRVDVFWWTLCVHLKIPTYAHTLQTWDCTNYDKFHGWFFEWPDSTVVVPHWEASEELYNVWVQACLNRVSVMKTRIALNSVDSFWDTNIRFFFHSIKLQRQSKQQRWLGGKQELSLLIILTKFSSRTWICYSTIFEKL